MFDIIIYKKIRAYLDTYLAPKVMEEPIIYAIAQFLEKEKQNAIAFHKLLFRFIDEKGYQRDAALYKKAHLDRRHFSKIRGSETYKPKRETVMALALALELTLEEADRLMAAAGYTFQNHATGDLIVRFCLENHIYNILDVNTILIHFCEPPLIGKLED